MNSAHRGRESQNKTHALLLNILLNGKLFFSVLVSLFSVRLLDNQSNVALSQHRAAVIPLNLVAKISLKINKNNDY